MVGFGVVWRGGVSWGLVWRGRVWSGLVWPGLVWRGGAGFGVVGLGVVGWSVAGRDGAERTMWYLKQLKLFLCPSDHLVDCFVVRKFVFVLSIVTTKKSEPSSKKQIKQVCLVVAIRDANKQ